MPSKITYRFIYKDVIITSISLAKGHTLPIRVYTKKRWDT